MDNLKEHIKELFLSSLQEGNFDKYKGMHGPLMNAGPWIGKSKLGDLANHPEINEKKGHVTLYTGVIRPNNSTMAVKGKPVAILHHDAPDHENDIVKKGYHKPHEFYHDTGLGYKKGSGELQITGHVHIHPDGKVTTHGDADLSKSHNLMVYK